MSETRTARTDLRAHFNSDVADTIARIRVKAARSGNPPAFISATLDILREENSPFVTAVCNGLLYFAEDAGLLGH
jgi:hypothetical protein